MKNHSIPIFLLVLMINTLGYAQNNIPDGYFSSPLQIKLDATGAFAEIRSNHFHSGVDFKTMGKVGLPILAVADGFISRIKVSPVGFGNALYIDHPNGLTSVYGHLLKYNSNISSYLFDKQYDEKSFAVDLFPAGNKDTLWIRKGDIIGYSGNSGTSFGAHLHFEMRTTSTERILNPYLFGFSNSDIYYPYFDLLKVYPMDNESCIGSSNEPVEYSLKNTGTTTYTINGGDTLSLWGRFSFGVQAFDYMYSKKDRNGFYGLRMLIDNQLFFGMQCDSFSFDETRNINACIDYAANYRNGQRIVKSNKLPGNTMSFINAPIDSGIVTLTDGQNHQLVIEVYDIKGRTSRLMVPVVSRRPEKMVSVSSMIDADTTCSVNWDADKHITYKDLEITISAGSLYDDLELAIKRNAPVNGLYSALYVIHSPEVPLKKCITIALKADKVPASFLDKALIISINPKNARRSAEGGTLKNGWISTETNDFGIYAITLDTIKPTVKLIAQKASAAASVKFSVSDDLSGIADYCGEINGQWALVEWDPKNRLMIYRYDKLLQHGKNTFKLVVKDAVGNTATATTAVFRK